MIDLTKWDMTIPERGWRSFLFGVGARISRDNISVLAAGVAFYVFVAIPSALTVIVSLYGLLFNPADVEGHVAAMAGVLPFDVITILSGFLTTLTANPPGKLSVSLLAGFLVAVWSTQSGTSAMITALNAVYEEREDRGLMSFYATSLAMTVSGIFFAVLGLALLGAVPELFDLLPWAGKSIATTLRWPIVFLLVATAIAGVYRYAPARDKVPRRWGFTGVSVATLGWIGTSALFSYYVSEFATYNQTFGSLGAVVVLLLWLYLTIFVVLVGAEINAEIESRAERRAS
jgi:membrane protein